jgi:predicted phosphoribosyltransferase/dienelactone hydrolase
MRVHYFRDRRDAGAQLASRLRDLRDEMPVVLGLPRGGVPVAYEVARALDAPLDVLLVRKLGVPWQPELAMGAIGEGGVQVLNPAVLASTRVSEGDLDRIEQTERRELERRARAYRGDRAMTSVRGRTVVLVDDGLATGSTARAAIEVLRSLGAHRLVLAVPVASREAVAELRPEVDALVVVATPPDFRALGVWYGDFDPTSDQEVVRLLAAARSAGAAETTGREADARDHEVRIDAPGVHLAGHLTIPAGAPGIVVFAHGSGSSRTSPRNVAVARMLNHVGLGSLLFDLLTHREAADRGNVFDVPLLATRLQATVSWLRAQPGCRDLRVGYFGASTGAAAALWAAASGNADVDAVVSRGGRPDLVGERLAAVRAPTLLVVGGRDHPVLELNQEAARRLTCAHAVEVVAGAGHLFEEPGALEQVSRLATRWFTRYLGGPAEQRLAASDSPGRRATA